LASPPDAVGAAAGFSAAGFVSLAFSAEGAGSLFDSPADDFDGSPLFLA
jgi:hypothetical protein